MSISRLLGYVWIAAVVVGLGGTGAKGVVNGLPVPNTDRRFDGIGLFLTVSPGAQGCGGWVSGAATLVAPDMVLVARHSLGISSTEAIPPLATRGYRVRFRRDAGGLSENAAILAGVLCHGTFQEIDVVGAFETPNRTVDHVLLKLAHPPAGIRPVAVELNNEPVQPTNIIMAGWGYSGQCFGSASGPTWELRMARGRSPGGGSLNAYFGFSPCVIGFAAPCLSCPTSGGPFVTANLHDSGSPILVEVPSTDPTDPTPELRIVATVSSTLMGQRPSAWNNGGGQPRLVQAASSVHLRKGDFNGDGALSTTDVLSYLGAFFAGRLDADSDQSGVLSVQDLLRFVERWFAGS